MKAVIRFDFRLELEGIEHDRAASKIAEQHHDFVTRDLFVHILEDEEDHQDHNKAELELIARIGVENFGLSQLWSHRCSRLRVMSDAVRR